MNRFPEAADAYKKAGELSPEDPLPKSRLATALMKAGDFAGSIAPLQALLKIEKDNPARIHAALAQAHLQSGHPAEAVEHARNAVQLAPTEAPYKSLLAEAEKAAKSGTKGKK